MSEAQEKGWATDVVDTVCHSTDLLKHCYVYVLQILLNHPV